MAIVAFKTAHGYLSFQPDGRVEYRPKRGPWEEFDIEGLEAVISSPPVPQPGPSPIDTKPQVGGTALVRDVIDELVRQGKDLHGANAIQITNTVAWLIREQGAGILDKPQGSHCEYPIGSGNFFATDIVIARSGNYVDILGDGGGANNPQWSVASDVLDVARWRTPINPETQGISLDHWR